MSEPFIGQIQIFPYNFAPRGWAFCNGQIMSIAQNTALFSLLGTTYGGNGQTTFALPDLRGRVPVSAGQGPGLSNYVLGEVIGTENVTLLSTQMPQHNHGLNASTGTKVGTTPAGNVLGGASIYITAAPDSVMAPASIGPAGGNQPFSVIQPLLCLNYCIALEGIFPSRN
jgi:microcystin-dependent protein